jgi:sulfite dehydrogenase
MKHDMSLPRRHMMGASLGTLAAASLATLTRGVSAQTAPLAAPRPLPTFVNWKDPSSLIVHSSSTDF